MNKDKSIKDMLNLGSIFKKPDEDIYYMRRIDVSDEEFKVIYDRGALNVIGLVLNSIEEKRDFEFIKGNLEMLKNELEREVEDFYE